MLTATRHVTCVAPVAAIGVRASMTTAASETCTAATLTDGRASGVTKRRR